MTATALERPPGVPGPEPAPPPVPAPPGPGPVPEPDPGLPPQPVVKGLAMAAEIEDEEIARELAIGK